MTGGGAENFFSATTDTTHTPVDHFNLVNIRGLMPRTVPTKVPYIQDIFQQKKHLFGMITETWLRDHLDAEINIPGYTIFRSDCKRPRKRRGRDTGGAAIYIREDIALLQLKQPSNFQMVQ